ncbi:MAG: hypothetical protein JW881_15020 [Spirochaetales bacterium]|nr:hypothetical protein [Spirochaetales bacterium]
MEALLYFGIFALILFLLVTLAKNPRVQAKFIRLDDKKAREIYKKFPKGQKHISIEEVAGLINWDVNDTRKIKITSFKSEGPLLVRRSGGSNFFRRPQYTKDDFKLLLWLLFCSDNSVEIDNY